MLEIDFFCATTLSAIYRKNIQNIKDIGIIAINKQD